MANTIEWGVILQNALDKQLIQGATSSWMEANAGQVQYTGGKEIKVPIMSVDGLGDYGRNTTGYPEGSVDLKYQTFEMRMDRAGQFSFDRHDVDESNYIVNASNVLSVFQETKVIPEIDSYRYSTIADVAIKKGYYEDYKPDTATIFGKLLNDVNLIKDRTGVDRVIITMNQLVYGMFIQSKEYSRSVSVADFARGAINVQVATVDGNPIIPVPSARMKTKYQYLSGGVDGMGFKADDAAEEMNWIICPQTAPLAISKTDNVKIWTPDQNQDKDSWKTQYRKYHDIWVMENKVASFHVSKQAKVGE